jgi:pilus assembly protein Flp/PilA
MRRALVLIHNLVARSGCRDERGATAVEYGLILIFIAVVIIAGLTVLGTRLDQLYHFVSNQI